MFLYVQVSILAVAGPGAKKGRRTVSVAGIVNFSITKSSTPSSLVAAADFLPCTTMYFGARSPSAAIFAGSRVSVAEKSSF